MRKSDIGRLFRKIGTAQQTPIENFTTEALAIAIEHDDSPMRRAVEAIVWPSLRRFRVARVEASTQHHLPKADSILMPIREGYLDLVLLLTLESGEKVTAWVEVKVDSPENDNQLDVYADHAQFKTPPPPIIFTLSKDKVREKAGKAKDVEVGWLSWKELAASIEAVDSGERWRDFLEFLRESELAWPPMPNTPVDSEAYLPVLIAVNNRIRELWPPLAWFGPDSAPLKNFARNEYTTHNRIVGTGGPLTYGLVPVDRKWAWSISLGNAKFQGVRLDPEEIVRQADHRELSSRWKRLGTAHAALQTCVPIAESGTHEEVTSWFFDALRELNEKALLKDFLDRLDARRAQASLSSS